MKSGIGFIVLKFTPVTRHTYVTQHHSTITITDHRSHQC